MTVDEVGAWIKKRVEEYGYSFKAYLLLLLIFPPGAIYVCCAKPDLALKWRITGIGFVLLCMAFGLLMGKEVVTLVVSVF